MEMLNIVLARSALETVPEEIINHPAVKKWAERRRKDPRKLLLDISYHYAAMKELKDWNRRGRPDIIHITLLNLLGSPLNNEGLLRVYVHTLHDYVITINPETNLPRNYLRFVGLIEQLFEIGRVPPKGNWLMKIEKKKLDELIKGINPSNVIMLTEKGKRIKLESFGKKILNEKNPLVIIGGFQRGEFSEEDLKLANEKYAIYKKSLDTWVIASMIVHEVERVMQIV